MNPFSYLINLIWPEPAYRREVPRLSVPRPVKSRPTPSSGRTSPFSSRERSEQAARDYVASSPAPKLDKTVKVAKRFGRKRRTR